MGATMARPNALKFYDGPSEIDGAPIVGIVSGLVTRSRNRKTGDLFQTWIMPRDVKPNDAVKTGDDVSVCGDCILRPTLHRHKPIEDWPCYVKTFQGPRSVWEATRDLSEATLSEMVNAPNRDAGIRLGAWGDPTAIPIWYWIALFHVLRQRLKRSRPGYTHQWRTCDPAWSGHVMASVHSPAEREQAKGRGFRTFRIIGDPSEVGHGEILCPNTTHGVQCADCGLCDGSTGVDWDGRKDIAIVVHR